MTPLKALLLVLGILSLITVASCANKSDNTDQISDLIQEGGEQENETEIDVPALAQKTGMDKCVICHGGTYAVWLKGPHANFNYFDSTYTNNDYAGFIATANYPVSVGNFIGFPGDAMIEEDMALEEYAGEAEDYCYACHGPEDLDNLAIAGLPLITQYGVIDWENATQNSRPVIGCETCHGGGNMHAVDPESGLVPYATPGSEVCGACHNNTFPTGHLTYHPNGSSIMEQVAASPHSVSINSHVYSDDEETLVRAKCSKCHTDEGARKYRYLDGNYDELSTAFATQGDLDEFSAIQCRTCHNAHNPEELLEPSTDAASAEFNTCTNCHQLFAADGTLIAAYHDPTVNTYGDVAEIITDTHYDDPTTADVIEGYVIDKTAVDACTRCHNPHSADNTINEQWTKSGHGNKSGEAWMHYDFKGADRTACQKCHTTTGYINYVADPTTYDPTLNVFVATDGQKELLYCYACHTDFTGTTRSVSAVKLEYESFNDTDTTDGFVQLDDYGKSNLCIVCHGGRKGGYYIESNYNATKNFGTYNPHYLAAAGILFRTGGYQFSGASYENVSYFEHNMIGVSNTAETGTNGPCVGCHLTNNDSHMFLPVTKDETTGAITAIASDDETCSKCHTGQYALTVEGLNEEEELFEATLEALKSILEGEGIWWSSGYPYYYTDNTYATAYVDWPNKSTLGAAYNYQLLSHEPGSWAHNRHYTKLLIFDSIDWIDNGVLDGTIDLTTYPDAAEYLQGNTTTTDDAAVLRPE